MRNGPVEYYNRLAERSGDMFNTGRSFSFHFGLYRRIALEARRMMDLKATDNILDLGGGCGQVTGYLAQYCHRVTLVDGARNALERAQARLHNRNNISYKLFDFSEHALPYESRSFDKIICYSVIHYLSSKDALVLFLGELIRCTKVGGIILVGDIPLQDKYDEYFRTRRNQPISNFILNRWYDVRQSITRSMYKWWKFDSSLVTTLSLTRADIEAIMTTFRDVRYEFRVQCRFLPFRNTREDLIIYVQKP